MYTIQIDVYTLFGHLVTFYPTKGTFENMQGIVVKDGKFGTAGVECIHDLIAANQWAKDVATKYQLETRRPNPAISFMSPNSEPDPNPELLPLVLSLCCGINERLKLINRLFDGIHQSIGGAMDSVEFRHHMSPQQKEAYRNDPPRRGGGDIFNRDNVHIAVTVIKAPMPYGDPVLFTM